MNAYLFFACTCAVLALAAACHALWPLVARVIKRLLSRPRPFPYEHSRWVVTDSRDATAMHWRIVR